VIHERSVLLEDELAEAIKMTEHILSTLSSATPTPSVRLARELYAERLQQLRYEKANHLEQKGDFPS
jgi:hypothetical protein